MSVVDDRRGSSGSGSPGRDAVNEPIEAGLLDRLMARVDGYGLALTGEGGTSPIARQSGKKKHALSATCTTTGSSTRSTVKRSPRCAPHPTPVATTTSCEPAASVTMPHSANLATGSSAFSTAASPPAAPTTKTPPGLLWA
jgi:hypothetical protein